MSPSPRGILLDIEGTTSSISFVYDVMFPYARKHFASYLAEHWNTPAVDAALPLLADDLAADSVEAMFGDDKDSDAQQKIVVARLIQLMDDDVKATGLKKIQGLVWQAGFHSGEMVAHVYDDVRPALEAWKATGIDIRIYSSGSVHAQHLFFQHSVAGDLLPFFSGHYDTTTGAKADADSYRAIANEFGLPSEEILFVSDVVAELEGALAAGMQTVLSIRAGNKAVENADKYTAVTSFDEIDV